MALYGRLYLPDGMTGYPLVILSHGFGETFRDTEDYAEAFAENGAAAFAFDFIGGGNGSRSGGSTASMSVLTEAADLDAVLDYFLDYPGIRKDRVFLFGESQGGFVSSYVAGKRPGDVAGLIALYPAYVLQSDSFRRNQDPGRGPETTEVMGVQIGRIYDLDAQSCDIYDVLAGYTGKTLILHGTADAIVPLSCSERALKTFPDAELITIAGAGHGFIGSTREYAAGLITGFVRELAGQPD